MKRVCDYDLYDFQKKGVDAILNGFDRHGCFLLGDEMGLGKTIQAYRAFILNNKDIHPVFPSLVICPSSLKHIWVELFHNDTRVVDEVGMGLDENMTGNTLVIVSYTTLGFAFKAFLSSFSLSYTEKILLKKIYNNKSIPIFHDVNPKYKWLYETCWSTIIIDEIHKLKNEKSLITKAVAALDADYRLGLTGTPFVNSGNDIITIIKYGLSMFDLRWEYIKSSPDSFYFNTILDNITLIRTKTDVGFKKRDTLNEDVIIPWVNRDEYTQLEYESNQERDTTKHIYQYYDESDKMFNQRKRANMKSFLGTLQLLRQKCLCKEKLDMLLQIYNSQKGKIVVFSTYKKLLKSVVSEYLTINGVSNVMYCGGSKKKQKDSLYKFKHHDSIRVLLVVKAAGALGLNLQDVSSTLVILEPHFNKALDEQIAGRIDRIGQKQNVVVKKLYMDDSIDMTLFNLQHEKQNIITAWTDGDIGGVRKSFDTTKQFFKKYNEKEYK